jgi:hypothetical protein
MNADEFGLWATPIASVASPRKEGQWMGKYFIKPNGDKSQTRLVDQVWMTRDQSLPDPPSGRLSPEWTEWLMGYPLHHTDCGALATPSCQPLPECLPPASTGS